MHHSVFRILTACLNKSFRFGQLWVSTNDKAVDLLKTACPCRQRTALADKSGDFECYCWAQAETGAILNKASNSSSKITRLLDEP